MLSLLSRSIWLFLMATFPMAIRAYPDIGASSPEPLVPKENTECPADIRTGSKGIGKIKKNKGNYLLLPHGEKSKQSPEAVLREFLFSNKADKYFEEQGRGNRSVKREYFREHDVEKENDKPPRENYKAWFKKHKPLFERTRIFEYWREVYIDRYNEFRESFKERLDKLVSKER
jgi:hypothetical protein